MTAGRRRLSIGGATVWFAVSYGGAIVGYLAVFAFAARLLGDTFGYFVIAVTVSTLLGQLGLFGVHRGGLREAARLNPNDEEGLSDLRRGVRAVSLVTLPCTSVLTATATFFVIDASNLHTRYALAAGMGVLVWLGGQQKLWANYLRGFGQVRFASLLEGRSGGALTAGFQGLFVGAVLLLLPSWGMTGALGAMALGYAIPVTLAWRQVSKFWRHVNAKGSIFVDLKMVITRYWRFASNLLGGYLNSTIELFIAGVVLTSLDVSLFSGAQRLAVLLSVPLTSLGVVFAPVVSRLYGHEDAKLEKLLRTGATFAAAITAVVWIPMLVAPGTVLSVLGPAFAAAAPLLVLLTLGNISNVLSGMCATALTMSRHEGVVATLLWVAVGVRLALGLALGLAFGAPGLAASAAAVTAALYLSLWLLTRRRMGLWTHLTLRPSLRLMRQTSG